MNKYPKLTIVLLVTVTQLALHTLEKLMNRSKTMFDPNRSLSTVFGK